MTPNETPDSPVTLANSSTLTGGKVAEVIGRRCEAWRGLYRIETAEDLWFFKQMVVHSLRLDNCLERQESLRACEAARAAACWEMDRRRRAGRLGSGLHRRPELTAYRLSTSKAGCDWMLGRWAHLAQAHVESGDWTETQTALAFDLLGVPGTDRSGNPWAEGEGPAGLMARERVRLERLKSDGLDALDALEHKAAMRGAPVRPGHELGRLRREESECRDLFERARSRLRRADPPGSDGRADPPRGPDALKCDDVPIVSLVDLIYVMIKPGAGAGRAATDRCCDGEG